ncbi:hypothetical protein BGZ94_002200 [Podila epigama]|nr:hypothetical protein BGZ94_002200 [Podila epigama]
MNAPSPIQTTVSATIKPGQAPASSSATSQHSLRQLVRTQITEYSRLTQLLFTTLELLADGRASPNAPNDIMKQIVQLDATLMGAVEKIELHQQQQRKILQVRQEIEEQNKAIMNVIQTLRGAKQVLELNLEDLEEKRAASADARAAEVSISEIVSYANKLSSYTSAPPNFNPQDVNQPFEPPYPREVNMRAGILNQQHIPAAALVTLDGGVMPGTTGATPGQADGGIGSAVGMGASGMDIGQDEDESGSSSEEEFSLYGRIQDEERRRQEQQEDQMQQGQQGEQQQQQEEEHAGDIFDLDLS